MRTKEEYLEKLRSMRRNVYMGGEMVYRDDPRIIPGINVIGSSFELVDDPELKDLLTATSHLTNQQINRFTHPHRSIDDLLKKQELTRKLCHRVGGCCQRCMGSDTINALSVATYLLDQEYGTEYYQHYLDYLKYYQENDLVANAAQTDVKGDRLKRPHQQEDPDLYLRVVEKKADGIVVRGAKAHNSIAPYADELMVLPTRAMTTEDKDWAVAFAIPADTPGVKLVIKASAPRERKHLHAPYANYGLADSLTIFDDVFVPWERVFMCGETSHAVTLASLFATFHRHSYCGCKPATTDIFLGASALVADYNGIAKAPHVREKLADLISVAELVYGAGIASAHTAEISASGTYIPNPVYTNVGRYHAGVNIYHEYDTLIQLAGGLPGTLPFEEDFYNPDTADDLHKYIMRRPGVKAEDQHRLFRFISDFTTSSFAGNAQVAGVHGGGSPIMEQISITSQYNIEEKVNIVKYLAGIK
ncbi:MAG: 4-hydroxyphenylacetate 3-hydroxylase family protein [Bacillota bacterium]